jgi:hypothetical protein
LTSTICFHCPDVIPVNSAESNSIPLNPPLEFFQCMIENENAFVIYQDILVSAIPYIGELMTASFPSDPKIISQNTWYYLLFFPFVFYFPE